VRKSYLVWVEEYIRDAFLPLLLGSKVYHLHWTTSGLIKFLDNIGKYVFKTQTGWRV
jgi:hypothetical protein